MTEEDTNAKVRKVIDTIRPRLQADGGDIELIDVKDNVAKVRLRGVCAGCPMAQMTLKNFVEAVIKKEVPGIKSVDAV